MIKKQGKEEISWEKKIANKQLEFSVFCIESVAEKLGLKGNEVYQLLKKQSQILDQYIIPNY